MITKLKNILEANGAYAIYLSFWEKWNFHFTKKIEEKLRGFPLYTDLHTRVRARIFTPRFCGQHYLLLYTRSHPFYFSSRLPPSFKISFSSSFFLYWSISIIIKLLLFILLFSITIKQRATFTPFSFQEFVDFSYSFAVTCLQRIVLS